MEALGIVVVRGKTLRSLMRKADSLSRLERLFTAMRDLSEDEIDDGRRFFELCMKRHDESFAQLFQDLFVLHELGEKRAGFFVEIGAADGVHLSNTYLLERQCGWEGILAEPARVWRRSLESNRSAIIEPSCIWSSSDLRLSFNEVLMPEYSTVASLSSSDLHAETREHGYSYDVPTLSLNDLLTKHAAPSRIDYLSIDTEGSELEILSAFDFDRYDVRIITVEHNHNANREKIHELLSSRGFERRFRALSLFDDWYVRQSPHDLEDGSEEGRGARARAERLERRRNVRDRGL